MPLFYSLVTVISPLDTTHDPEVSLIADYPCSRWVLDHPDTRLIWALGCVADVHRMNSPVI